MADCLYIRKNTILRKSKQNIEIMKNEATLMIERKSTKELILSSLYDLLRENPYEKVTVSAIVKNCGISQRTFYHHFKDKYDLMEWSYLHELDEYYEQNRADMTFRRWLRLTAETAWESRLALQKFTQYSGQNSLRVALQEPLTERCLNVIHDVYGDSITEELKRVVSFYIGGLISYVERVLNSTVIPTPEESVSLFEMCVPVCMRKYL